MVNFSDIADIFTIIFHNLSAYVIISETQKNILCESVSFWQSFLII